jgi:integrase
MLLTGHIVTHTKRGRVVTVPVTPRLRLLIDLAVPMVGEEDVRFVDLLNGRRLIQGKQTINERWWRWKKIARLPDELHIHDMRRDAAHRVYLASRDLRQVQGMLGHESPMTTVRYLHLASPTVSDEAVAGSLIEVGHGIGEVKS